MMIAAVPFCEYETRIACSELQLSPVLRQINDFSCDVTAHRLLPTLVVDDANLSFGLVRCFSCLKHGAFDIQKFHVLSS